MKCHHSPNSSSSGGEIFVIPGTVASSTPPGARMRCNVANAARTSQTNWSVWVTIAQSNVSSGMCGASVRSPTIVAWGLPSVAIRMSLRSTPRPNRDV